MNVHPILATLRRHKTAAGLIALEIALSCAIVSNAVFLIGDRLDRIRQPSGLAEAELVHFQLVGITRVEDPEAQAAEDMAALRAVPGVRSVATVNQIPFGNSSWYSSLNLEPEQQNPTMQVTTYVGSEDLLETMGLSLVSGRDFVPEEYVEFQQAQSDPEVVIPAVIVSRAVADRLFPGENPLGRSVYVWGAAPQRIVGVVEHLAKPNDIGGPSSEHTSVIMPVSAPVQYGINYLVRVDAGRRDGVLEEGVAALEAVNPSRIVLEDRTRTFEAFRDDYFQDDRAMAWLLVGVCVALLVVTALGHRRPGELLGAAAYPADRHPPRPRRDPGPDHRLLPDGELPDRDHRHRRRHGARLRHQRGADGTLRAAPAALVLPAAGRGGAVDPRPASRCSARRCARAAVPPAVATRSV